MLAIIGYLFLATLTSALTQLAASRKTMLWDWIGCIPFFASILFSISFGIRVIDIIPTPDFTPDAVIMTWQFLGTAFFICLGVVASYVAGDALLTHGPAYVGARRQKHQDDKPTQ